ncbi:MAG: response regulator [Mycobacteriales bacterium]
MSSDHSSPARPSQAELTALQLQAIDGWNRGRRAAEAAADSEVLTRERRLDVSRRNQARRREHEAVLARAAEQLRTSGGLLGRVELRAVLAHRNEWLRTKVASRLAVRGIAVVGEFDDGADAAGTIVVEQPDLVLVEDRLPTLSGLEVLSRVRSFSPRTVVGAQVLEGEGIQQLVDAGAQAVFTRRNPPAEIADLLADCLQGSRQLVATG